MITKEYLDTLIQKDKEKGLFRCKREMFTNKDLFDLEMKHIFEGNWIYLAHESQLPKVNDYYTTKIGRQPVFITRNKDGVLNCFINACAHRGATLARRPAAMAPEFGYTAAMWQGVCPAMSGSSHMPISFLLTGKTSSRSSSPVAGWMCNVAVVRPANATASMMCSQLSTGWPLTAVMRSPYWSRTPRTRSFHTRPTHSQTPGPWAVTGPVPVRARRGSASS